MALCDDGFNQGSAEVFCRELFNDPTVIAFSHGHPCAPLTDFWLDDVICNGDEVSLAKCPHSAWG